MRAAGYPGSPYMYLRAASFPVYLRALAFALQAVGLASLLVALLQRQAPPAWLLPELACGLLLNLLLMLAPRAPAPARRQQRLDDQQADKQAYVEAQRRILGMISTRQPLASTLGEICRLVESRGSDLRCSIMTASGDGRRLQLAAAPNLPADYSEAIASVPIREGIGSCGTAAHRRQPVLSADTARDPAWTGLHELLARHALNSCWSTPLLAGDGQLLGTFGIYRSHSAGVEAELEERVATASHLAGLAIEHLQAHARLQDSEQRFRSLFSCSPDPVLAFALDGRIQQANPAACALFGHDETRLCGSHYSRHLPGAEAQRILPRLRRSAVGQPSGFEVQGVDAAGQPLELEVTLMPIVTDSGIVGVFCVAKDIHQRKAAERTLQATLDELARSNRELQEFAFVASHDLQEPLRKIQAFAERLQSRASGLDDQCLDYLQRMSGAAVRMQGLIRDLLAYSRVATRAQPFVRLSLDALLDEVLHDLEGAIEAEGAQIVREPLPCIDGDPLQIRQLLQNLLGNAIKFHAPGQAPQVSIRAWPDEAGRHTLCVSDRGVGFDEKYLDRIFNPFQRLHGRQDYPGTGMGLAIVKKIVERHGATLSASSRPGEGARFCVSFPVREQGA